MAVSWLSRSSRQISTKACRAVHGLAERAVLSVGFEGGWVEVDVANDRAAGGPAAQAGSGLVGMRERVHAVGGTLEAGPTGDGRRWLVRARIPA